jgi:hypothetical protein
MAAWPWRHVDLGALPTLDGPFRHTAVNALFTAR